MSEKTKTEEVKDINLPAGAKYALEVDVEDEGGETKVCYLRGLSRAELGVVFSLIMPSGGGQADYIRAGEVILSNAVVPGGDWEEIEADEDLFIGACFQAYSVVQIKTGRVKKL